MLFVQIYTSCVIHISSGIHRSIVRRSSPRALFRRIVVVIGQSKRSAYTSATSLAQFSRDAAQAFGNLFAHLEVVEFEVSCFVLELDLVSVFEDFADAAASSVQT